MDFTTLDDSEFADVVADMFDSLHTRVNGLDDGDFKNRAARLADLAHGAFNALMVEAKAAGVITPLSGGDPKISA